MVRDLIHNDHADVKGGRKGLQFLRQAEKHVRTFEHPVPLRRVVFGPHDSGDTAQRDTEQGQVRSQGMPAHSVMVALPVYYHKLNIVFST